MSKPTAKWFFGVDNKADFYQYANNAYSEQKMIVLHPDEMQEIAIEGIAIAEHLGVACPLHFAGMAEDPIPYMNDAVAEGLIPDYHFVTKFNAANGTNYRNEYEFIVEQRKLSCDPHPELRVADDTMPMQMFASSTDSVVVIAADEDIDDIDAYVARAGAAFASGSDETCPDCGESECECDSDDSDDEDNDDSECDE
jgi:hypothetical protein